MENKDKVLYFQKEFDELDESLSTAECQCDNVFDAVSETSALCDALMEELLSFPKAMLLIENDSLQEVDSHVTALNETIDEIIIPHYKGVSDINAVDVVVSVLAGVIASVIDIAFVGSPEVVKIYRGGENFDGSVLTAALRKIGNGDDKLSEMLKWLSDKCKVSYDISIATGAATPNNHRLRSFAHDPLIGMLFAIADIVMGTATLIDNEGKLKVIVNGRDYPDSQKIMAVVYYLGHLLSDVCTARGLPIPGFIVTQLFADDTSNSIAKVCEQMYMDGYDLRHFASMSAPVMVKNLIVDIYIKLFKDEELTGLHTIAEKEIEMHRKEMFRHKLILISDAVAWSGNVAKFFLPPTMGNPTALNLPEWMSLIKSTIINLKYQLRDKDIERVIFNRSVISNNWIKLLD